MADTTPVQPTVADGSDLAVGAADTATPTTQETGLESGMTVISTPQGKASVDKNAPPQVTDVFNIAATPSPANPTSTRGKGKLVVQQAMVTTAAGVSYSAGNLVDPKDLTDDEKDLFTAGDSPALVPFGK